MIIPIYADVKWVCHGLGGVGAVGNFGVLIYQFILLEENLNYNFLQFFVIYLFSQLLLQYCGYCKFEELKLELESIFRYVIPQSAKFYKCLLDENKLLNIFNFSNSTDSNSSCVNESSTIGKLAPPVITLTGLIFLLLLRMRVSSYSSH